jgi:superfamily II DNA/RNA helicase
VFVSRKSDCDYLAESLFDWGYKADSLHGDKSQMLRERTMTRFHTSRVRILVATDVASRGLDVRDIEVVVNYDFPVGSSGVESYVHRIGRTGRGGSTGASYTFFTASDRDRAKELVELMKRSDQVSQSLLSQ